MIDGEYAHAPAAKEALGLFHAAVTRQRQLAQRFQRIAAIEAASHVPHAVANQNAKDGKHQHRQQLSADRSRMDGSHRPEEDEGRHRGHG